MKILDNEKNCTGCMACYNICPHHAIGMVKNEEGFLYPNINNDLCVNCGLCKKTCPVVSGVKISDRKKEIFAFQSSNKDLLKKSSSGAFFSIASNEILKSNGFIFGAAFDSKLKLSHICVNTKDTLDKLRGSKYLQSEIGNSFFEAKKLLDNGVKVLYTGTSCQIAGLKNFLHKEYENLITIDLVCHGVPSPLVFEKYINWIEKKSNATCTDFSFRKKKWSWHVFNVNADLHCKHAGTLSTKNYIGTWHRDPYMRGFLRELYLRPCCHTCKYASTLKPADITVGDFWGYKKHKKLKDNDTGISMVMINTEKGNRFFSEVDKGAYNSVTVDLEEAVNGNPALRAPFPPSPVRDMFWKDLFIYDFDIIIEKYLYAEKVPLKMKPVYWFGTSSVLYKIFDFSYRGTAKIFRICHLNRVFRKL